MPLQYRPRWPAVLWIVCSLVVLTSACQAATGSGQTDVTPVATAVPSTIPPTMASLPATAVPTTVPMPTGEPSPAASPTLIPESSPTADLSQQGTPTPEELIQAFVDAPFRVVAVVRPPGEYNLDFPYELLVVTQRALRRCGLGEERCTDDTTCGSLYTSPVCYFFLEPQYVYGANPLPRFVGQWQGGLDGLVKDSLALSGDGKLQFQSTGGDGPCWVRAMWELDTTTALISELSREEGCQE